MKKDTHICKCIFFILLGLYSLFFHKPKVLSPFSIIITCSLYSMYSCIHYILIFLIIFPIVQICTD